MKKFAIVFILISAFALTAFGQKAKPTPAKPAPAKLPAAAADEKAVREVFEDLLNGIRNSNVDAVTGVYWNSPQTLYFNSNGSITLGWEQDRKNRESLYPRTSNVKLDASQVRVTMLGSEGALV